MRYDLTYRSIPGLVRAAAVQWGDEIYLVDGDEQWSFRDLEARMIDLARGLIALGIQPGDRVALCAPNSARWVQAATAVHAVGGVLVPLSTRFKADELRHILDSSGAKAVLAVDTFAGNDYVQIITDATSRSAAPAGLVLIEGAAREGALTLDELVERGASVLPQVVLDRIDAISPDDVADILFTSGTTGRAKGVPLGHGQSLQAYGWLSEMFTYRARETFAIIPPFFHGFGYKAGWLAGLLRGLRIIPISTFEPLTLLETIQREGVNLLNGPPAVFIDLMNHPRRDEFDLSSLRVGTTGAATIPLKVITDMRERLGLEVVVNAYGLTESTALVSTSRPGDDPERVATTVGRAADGLEVIVVDDDGVAVEPGVSGEIWVRGYTVMRGYWNDDAATAEAITPEGFLRTGDIGVLDDDGFIRITDRKKDLFIVGGFNAYPAEIEAILLRCPGIHNIAVVGAPDERMGEVGWAFVVREPDADLTEGDVVSFARAHLANFKVPRRVVFLDDLPRTPSLKVTKEPLRELVSTLSSIRAGQG